MSLPHNVFVLVADGEKYLMLRNRGTVRQPALAVEAHDAHDSQPTHLQGSDSPGRVFASTGAIRSSVEQTDFHRLEKEKFAARTAAMLAQRAAAGDFDELIVVAPARTLAELRKHYDAAVQARIKAEIDKDLTNHPVAEITAILGD